MEHLAPTDCYGRPPNRSTEITPYFAVGCKRQCDAISFWFPSCFCRENEAFLGNFKRLVVKIPPHPAPMPDLLDYPGFALGHRVLALRRRIR